MTRTPGRRLALGAVLLALIAVAALIRARQVPSIGACTEAHRAPRISPDYAGVVMPPNIAPLNFRVDEPGRRWVVRVSGARGRPIELVAAGGAAVIPLPDWRALLGANRGGEVRFDVLAQEASGRWTHFDPIRNQVAQEEIDSTLAYRRLRPIYNEWLHLGIYQRDLTSFRESAILENRQTRGECLNCHTFLQNRPDRFFFQTRPTDKGKGVPSLVLVQDGKATRIDTRTSINPRAATYSAWHPSGKLIAFSYNQIMQFFHAAGSEPREVVDQNSGLAIMTVDGRKVSTTPGINDPKRLETFPTWSPDGKWLYFCSAPAFWDKGKGLPYQEVLRVRYDLVRIPFDIDHDTWGAPETVLSARQANGSLLEPRVSPDGHFLLFTRCDYGSFPIHQQHTDLYLMDLRRPGFPYHKLDAAPESQRDSWHSWSSNSRWVVFSRKKDYGLVARPYLRYVDAEGKGSKPLMLPQADPGYYDRCTDTFNVPELVKGPVQVSWRELAKAANNDKPAKATAAP